MAVALAHRLQAAGLAVCLPEVAAPEERRTEVEAAYNLHLALHLARQAQMGEQKRRVVTNDLRLGPRGYIVILTGLNQDCCPIWHRQRAFARHAHGAGRSRSGK